MKPTACTRLIVPLLALVFSSADRAASARNFPAPDTSPALQQTPRVPGQPQRPNVPSMPSNEAPHPPPTSNHPVPLADAPLRHKAKAATPDSIVSQPPLLVPQLSVAPKLEDFVSGNPTSPAAQAMQQLTGFIQQDPEDGAPITEDTSAYIGYSARSLYLAFICHDSQLNQIRAHLVPRDEVGDDDKVEVTLDTFDDHRRGLLFQTNPLGVQADATWTEGNSDPDFSFDTVWDTWGRRTPFGYVVLMRIPFQSLRFQHTEAGQPQIWGLVLRRWIAHASERAYWPRVTRRIAGRLTQDAAVRGFVDVQRGHNIQLIPYVLGQSRRHLDNRDPMNPTFTSKLFDGTAGIDAKVVLHDSLVFDATLNPDFSQVSINDPASPNQRFQPFFYEQRPFFIENASYFATPIDLFYTLNIVSPQFGARLSGKRGPWALGILATDDRGPGQAVAPSSPDAKSRAQFYVSRIARDIGPFSSAGVLYTDHEYKNSFNRLGGIDYRYRFHKQWTMTGQGVTSVTRSLDNSTTSGNSFKQNINYSGQHLYFTSTYNDTGKGFSDAVGFFRRPDIRETHVRPTYTWRPNGKYLLAHGPDIYLEQDWDHTGLSLDSIAHFNYNFVFNRSTSLTPYFQLSDDRLRPSDYSTLSSTVEYRSQIAGLNLSTAPTTQVAFSLSGYVGKTVNYNPPTNQPPASIDVESINMNLEVHPITRLDLQNRYEFDRFRDPATDAIAYDNHLVVSRWNLQFNRALAVRLIGVYQSTQPNATFTAQQNSKDLFGNALISYVPHPGTAIYVGYTSDAQNLDPTLCTRLESGTCNPNGVYLNHTGDNLLNTSRTLYMKLSYLLRF
ncbi:DUF5916 domain-containing protein [soil metagenome]